MTLTELAELVSRRTGYPPEETWTICEALASTMIEVLRDGHSVKVRRLGTFSWKKREGGSHNHPTMGPTELPDRMVLKFTPSVEFREVQEEVMEKLGVEYDESKVKEAEKGKNPNACPICGKDGGESRNCPDHGTEPFEKKKEDK